MCSSDLEFGNLTASEVMVPRVQMTSVQVGASADELRRIVGARLHTRYPVHAGNPDDILGCLHIKDVITHLVSGEPISMIDVRPVPYVPVTALLDEVLTARTAQHERFGRLLDTLLIESLPETVEVLENGTVPTVMCFHVVLEEEFEHLRYALRDLATLGLQV